MANTERVTVTLPTDLIERIDGLEHNRSRFIADVVRHELVRRRRDALMRSLAHPHPESSELASMGLSDWAASLPAADESVVDPGAGTPVRWVHGEGWIEEGT